MRNSLVALFVALLMVGCGGEINQPNFEKFVGPHGFMHDLSDPEVRERIFAKAIDYPDFERRFVDGHYTAFAPGQQTPYTGWAKKDGGLGLIVYVNGRIR